MKIMGLNCRRLLNDPYYWFNCRGIPITGNASQLIPGEQQSVRFRTEWVEIHQSNVTLNLNLVVYRFEFEFKTDLTYSTDIKHI